MPNIFLSLEFGEAIYMKKELIKEFEKKHEGIVVFNSNCSLYYINEVGSNWLWGNKNDEVMSNRIKYLVSNFSCDNQHRSIMVPLRNIHDNGKIWCSIAWVNGYILAVLEKNMGANGPGLDSSYHHDEVRDRLYSMSSIFVGNKHSKTKDNHIV